MPQSQQRLFSPDDKLRCARIREFTHFLPPLWPESLKKSAQALTLEISRMEESLLGADYQSKERVALDSIRMGLEYYTQTLLGRFLSLQPNVLRSALQPRLGDPFYIYLLARFSFLWKFVGHSCPIVSWDRALLLLVLRTLVTLQKMILRECVGFRSEPSPELLADYEIIGLTSTFESWLNDLEAIRNQPDGYLSSQALEDSQDSEVAQVKVRLMAVSRKMVNRQKWQLCLHPRFLGLIRDFSHNEADRNFGVFLCTLLYPGGQYALDLMVGPESSELLAVGLQKSHTWSDRCWMVIWHKAVKHLWRQGETVDAENSPLTAMMPLIIQKIGFMVGQHSLEFVQQAWIPMNVRSKGVSGKPQVSDNFLPFDNWVLNAGPGGTAFNGWHSAAAFLIYALNVLPDAWTYLESFFGSFRKHNGFARLLDPLVHEYLARLSQERDDPESSSDHVRLSAADDARFMDLVLGCLYSLVKSSGWSYRNSLETYELLVTLPTFSCVQLDPLLDLCEFQDDQSPWQELFAIGMLGKLLPIGLLLRPLVVVERVRTTLPLLESASSTKVLSALSLYFVLFGLAPAQEFGDVPLNQVDLARLKASAPVFAQDRLGSRLSEMLDQREKASAVLESLGFEILVGLLEATARTNLVDFSRVNAMEKSLYTALDTMIQNVVVQVGSSWNTEELNTLLGRVLSTLKEGPQVALLQGLVSYLRGLALCFPQACLTQVFEPLIHHILEGWSMFSLSELKFFLKMGAPFLEASPDLSTHVWALTKVLLDKCLTHEDHQVFKGGVRLMGAFVHGISTVKPRDYKLVDPGRPLDSNYFFYEWGLPSEPRQINWYVPGPAEGQLLRMIFDCLVELAEGIHELSENRAKLSGTQLSCRVAALFRCFTQNAAPVLEDLITSSSESGYPQLPAACLWLLQTTELSSLGESPVIHLLQIIDGLPSSDDYEAVQIRSKFLKALQGHVFKPTGLSFPGLLVSPVVTKFLGKAKDNLLFQDSKYMQAPRWSVVRSVYDHVETLAGQRLSYGHPWSSVHPPTLLALVRDSLQARPKLAQRSLKLLNLYGNRTLIDQVLSQVSLVLEEAEALDGQGQVLEAYKVDQGISGLLNFPFLKEAVWQSPADLLQVATLLIRAIHLSDITRSDILTAETLETLKKKMEGLLKYRRRRVGFFPEVLPLFRQFCQSQWMFWRQDFLRLLFASLVVHFFGVDNSGLAEIYQSFLRDSLNAGISPDFKKLREGYLTSWLWKVKGSPINWEQSQFDLVFQGLPVSNYKATQDSGVFHKILLEATPQYKGCRWPFWLVSNKTHNHLNVRMLVQSMCFFWEAQPMKVALESLKDLRKQQDQVDLYLSLLSGMLRSATSEDSDYWLGHLTELFLELPKKEFHAFCLMIVYALLGTGTPAHRLGLAPNQWLVQWAYQLFDRHLSDHWLITWKATKLLGMTLQAYLRLGDPLVAWHSGFDGRITEVTQLLSSETDQVRKKAALYLVKLYEMAPRSEDCLQIMRACLADDIAKLPSALKAETPESMGTSLAFRRAEGVLTFVEAGLRTPLPHLRCVATYLEYLLLLCESDHADLRFRALAVLSKYNQAQWPYGESLHLFGSGDPTILSPLAELVQLAQQLDQRLSLKSLARLRIFLGTFYVRSSLCVDQQSLQKLRSYLERGLTSPHPEIRVSSSSSLSMICSVQPLGILHQWCLTYLQTLEADKEPASKRLVIFGVLAVVTSLNQEIPDWLAGILTQLALMSNHVPTLEAQAIQLFIQNFLRVQQSSADHWLNFQKQFDEDQQGVLNMHRANLSGFS